MAQTEGTENGTGQSLHDGRLQRMQETRVERTTEPDHNSFVTNEAVPVDIKRVITAYFAEKKTELVRSEESGGTFDYSFNNPNTITDENRGRIATIIVNNSTAALEADSKYVTEQLVLNALENRPYAPGETLPIETYKITEEVEYKKIDKGTLNTDAYIVAECSGLAGESATIEVFEKEPLLAEADTALTLSVYASEEDDDPAAKTAITETVGEDHKIIVKIKFHPDDDDTFNTWKEAYDPATGEDETASTATTQKIVDYLWIKVTAPGVEDDNEFLKKDGEWFELRRCNCCDATVGDDGFVTHEKFIKEHITALERGNLAAGNAIVLHRTVNNTAEETFTAFRTGTGTHFAVDKAGIIYQTASLNKLTYHVGKIRSRCMAENSCSAEETTLIQGWGWAPTRIHNHEKVKSYPDRYPKNSDSIGIEVVGDYNATTEQWDSIPTIQAEAVACVVNFLIKHYNLSTADDIYEHEDISYKTEGEGSVVYEAIKDIIE